ncbi:MurR/RpiR family transcriptional regulator [Aureimonas fodinaquatilis]|uniref:MurR/RpiR family transcriptional regulator n=1 Tax=Aureimonas fodinaquatilis TaxID=2565783 RepID=A0A5B0DSA6_9HYPH|nr:MurR/RpiR family transcriptional regulator [Aureimonas fodinaquatilis]KAA0969684.1 MurR/RpiR family transcriptional regulator [Aureimonas fodinaquatilis]
MVERIQAVADSLTVTEQKLVSALLTAPREVAIGTSSEFAARIGVHEATTSRLARKLGFASYAGFRDALRGEYLRDAAPAERISATLSDVRSQGFLPLLLASEIAALSALADHVSDERILDAAQALNRDRVFIYGHGNASALSELMERRLRRLGIVSHRLGGNRRDLAEQVLTLTENDALLLFAFRRQPPDYADLVDIAIKAGARTLVISGTCGPSLTPRPDLLLSAPRAGMPGSFQTLTVPMAICNAVVLALASLRGEAAMTALDRLGDLITRLEK